ncbi:hypothetical protein BU26DRAFT_512670 [Trematosphaeria pertusa]|uniref:Uncharacterized protein n=1 Tax=Trematosphaeria pertusa TaxID=390896 RepID=A0A6A6IZ15_9PLEO|nr:uncharacterized protein BU26DRAFT_512670 [Trematosphaeria pertusa]KAF2255699.1 hypothetical protein BU26DRAFT_512670 [Trematosphaeria pertusa]
MRLLWLVSVPLVSARVVRIQQQSLTEEVENAGRAIGIHFTNSHATAAVRYENGTVEDLARVAGDANYIALMTRWSKKCAPSESLRCRMQREARQRHADLRQPLGVDATILSSMLRQVKTVIEDKLESAITNVLPVFPPLAALNEEHIEEAFEHAGLTWLHARQQEEQILYETNAAYAGLGYSLCEFGADGSQCAREENELKSQHVLFLNFDNTTFSATLQNMKNAYQQQISATFLDTTLGWWNLPVYDEPRLAFWARIEAIVFAVGNAIQQPPNKIILMGEHGGDQEFVEVVEAALWELFEYDASLLMEANADVNSATLAARGAAELAFRAGGWNEGATHASLDAESIEL